MEKMTSDSTDGFNIQNFLKSTKAPAKPNVSKLTTTKTEVNPQPIPAIQ
jgi:hypothetical protein